MKKIEEEKQENKEEVYILGTYEYTFHDPSRPQPEKVQKKIGGSYCGGP